MPEQELWEGERSQRQRIMERMEEDRIERERHALDSAGADPAADYRRRLEEQGLDAPDSPSDGRASDAQIAAKIRRGMEDDGLLGAGRIEVDVADGEVTLSGTVADGEARRRAEALVERVEGVARIANRLQVR
jgi:osmotically-inducible protein OsmY